MMMVSTSFIPQYCFTNLNNWSWTLYLQPTGATVSLNETNIVVVEGTDNYTNVDICIVLANDMGGLQRDVVVELTGNNNSESTKLLRWVETFISVHTTKNEQDMVIVVKKDYSKL